MSDYVNIIVDQLHWIVIPIPESLNTDTVTIEIRRLSDNYTWNFTTLEFAETPASGSLTFVSDITWKASFTPPTADTYVVTIEDETLDIKHVQVLRAIVQSPTAAVVPPTSAETTPAALLAAVNAAIATRLSGGAVQSYSIGNRNLQYMTLSELMALRKQLAREVAISRQRTNLVTFGDCR